MEQGRQHKAASSRGAGGLTWGHGGRHTCRFPGGQRLLPTSGCAQRGGPGRAGKLAEFTEPLGGPRAQPHPSHEAAVQSPYPPPLPQASRLGPVDGGRCGPARRNGPARRPDENPGPRQKCLGRGALGLRGGRPSPTTQHPKAESHLSDLTGVMDEGLAEPG